MTRNKSKNTSTKGGSPKKSTAKQGKSKSAPPPALKHHFPKKKQGSVSAGKNTVAGDFIANAKGFGFVNVGVGLPDVFIPAPFTAGAMQGDSVLVEIVSSSQDGRKQEGRIAKITKRGRESIVGRFKRGDRGATVIVEERRTSMSISVSASDDKGAQDNDIVVVRITEYPKNRFESPRGVIVEVLGQSGAQGVDITAIVRAYQLPVAFSPPALSQAQKAALQPILATEPGRLDLRDEVIFTIDGADAKDLDDAVSLTQIPGDKWRLGVHIADVSWYVRPGTKLDDEAYERGTSVYFPDRVIPMLPESLSNGACSLNPDIDRYALAEVIGLDASGTVVASSFAASIIRSRMRLTYDEVNQFFAGQEGRLTGPSHRAVGDKLQQMRQLAQQFIDERESRGAIDFDFAESKIVLDENGKAVGITKRTRGLAERLIEQFMLTANEAVAKHFSVLEKPLLFRVHEYPDSEAMIKLSMFLEAFGYELHAAASVEPLVLQKILHQADGKPEELVVSTMLLRSLKKARYAPENLGHYGLASKNYAHFTSPIRRYPDLVVHRMLKAQAIKGAAGKSFPDYPLLEAMGQHTSYTERRADEAEREADDLKKAEYMEGFIGVSYTGIISGITSFGIFVELANTVEGLIPLDTLPGDQYDFNDKALELIGKRNGERYHIGKSVEITVQAVDLISRRVYFVIKGCEVEDILAPKIPAKPAPKVVSRKRRRRK